MVLIVEYLSNATFKKKFLVILKHSRTRSLDYIIILYFFWVVTKNEDGKGEWTTDPFKQFLHYCVARVMNHKIFCIRIVFAIIYSLLIATKMSHPSTKNLSIWKYFVVEKQFSSCDKFHYIDLLFYREWSFQMLQ